MKINNNSKEKIFIYTLLAVTALPHIFHLPLLLNLYILIFSLYLYFEERFHYRSRSYALIFFVVLGLVFGVVEYIKYLNISDLSRAKIFIDIITSLLIFISSLLILDRFESPFLKITPVLLLMMSLFYYESLLYLLYTVAVLFIAVAGTIYQNSKISIQNALKYTLSMFIASLPIVIILFLTFPRISYKNSNFGFKGEEQFITGFGDSISFGSGKRLLQSNRVAMEIMFLDRVPPKNGLYFRGNTLYNYDKSGVWSRRDDIISFEKLPDILYSNIDKTVEYRAVVYPTFNKSLPQLDYPLEFPAKSRIDLDYTIKLKKNLFKSKKFEFKSAIRAKLKYINPKIKEVALALPEGNPKSKVLAKKIKSSAESDIEAIEKLKEFFKSLNFIYTLKPPKLESKNKIDEIIFKNRKGYCVHLSSSFAYILRAMNIPSRVVSGYRGSGENLLKNYLLIRAKDAHSWVEAYTENSGWIRIDPTDYALVTNESDLGEKSSPFWQKVSLKLLYFKYKVEEWVLYYSRVKQMKIIESLKKNRELIIYIFFGFLSMAFLLSFLSKKSLKLNRQDRVSKIYYRLLAKLSKKGIKKSPNEGASSFAKRVKDERVTEITNLYLKLKYATKNLKSKESKILLKEFEKKVREFE